MPPSAQFLHMQNKNENLTILRLECMSDMTLTFCNSACAQKLHNYFYNLLNTEIETYFFPACCLLPCQMTRKSGKYWIWWSAAPCAVLFSCCCKWERSDMSPKPHTTRILSSLLQGRKSDDVVVVMFKVSVGNVPSWQKEGTTLSPTGKANATCSRSSHKYAASATQHRF